MFSRRRNSRAAAHTANTTPASSAASTAAVQAFLASQAPSSSLSSAAAAAALRSHTTSPTNPALVQTKRMQRRLSNSSNGSASSRPALQRTGSSGSMTERSFRDPSPLRTASPLAGRPPIPPIPQNLPQSRKLSGTRPLSTEPPSRVKSPVSKESNNRSASLDRGSVKTKRETAPPLPKIKPTKINTKLPESAAKRISINFSRPISPALSPPTTPIAPANGRVAKPVSKAAPVAAADNSSPSSQNGTTNIAKKKETRTGDKQAKSSQAAVNLTEEKPSEALIKSEPVKDDKSPIGATQTAPSSQKPSEQQSVSKTEPDTVTPKSIRPGGKLTKQPSMVKEDVEGEALAEQITEMSTAKSDDAVYIEPSKTPNGKVLAAPNVTPATSQALATPETSDLTRRRSSLSPTRTARFSAQPVYDLSGGIKHEPPLRAVSPAKSALKQSPSPRGPSPALMHGDVPDNVSVASEEGKRKRRSVRVSFENEPVVVGDAAESNVSQSPVLFSPQNKDPASRPQFNFRRKLDDAETDVIITPVPTLPSFGSIRGRNGRQDDDDHKVLYGDEQARKNLVEMTSSNDHAIGAIVAQDITSKQSVNNPIPPQVTSVEGSGYHSDIDSSDDEDHRPTTTSNAVELLPMISVVPATPGHEIDKEDQESWLSRVPGSFDENESFAASAPKEENVTAVASTPAQKADRIPERESIVEPEPESAQREHDPHALTIGVIAESLRKQDDEHDDSDSGDSVYSDAAEEPTEFEGDGFGSINAIVDSPLVSPVIPPFADINKTKVRAQDESPSPAGREQPLHDWDTTKSYWSGVNESKKNQNNTELVGVAITSSPEDEATDSPKIEKPIIPEKSIARTQNDTSNLKTVPKAPVIQTKNTPNPIPKKSALKSSMRQTSESISPKAEAPTMKKTMRGPHPTSMTSNTSTAPARSSVVSSPRKDSGISQAASPNKSLSASSTVSGATNIKKSPARTTQPALANGSVNGGAKRMSTMSTKSALPAQTPRSAPPKVTRTMSNGSDSSSSFKRERARQPKQERGYSMKRSMRAAPSSALSSASPPPNSRTTLPSRPMSMSGVSLRTSMRDNPATSLRPSSVRVASPNGSFFGRKKKADDKPPLSRNFSDSSAGEVPTTYRSRFADSSDEEDVPTKFTPVRGIPRRTVEEDSTDLDDSDEESKPKPKPASRGTSSNVVPKTSGLAAKSMRPQSPDTTPAVNNLTSMIPTDKKRKSIFGALGRRKDKSKIGKSELDSAARRDTPLERTKFERKETDNRAVTPEPPSPLDTPLESPAASPSSAIRPGKLQRRNTSQRLGSDSWFPPPAIPPDELTVRRPTTSDGAPSRPALGSRNVSNTTYTADGVAVGRTGKKKRFPMLRKAFGLHD